MTNQECSEQFPPPKFAYTGKTRISLTHVNVHAAGPLSAVRQE